MVHFNSYLYKTRPRKHFASTYTSYINKGNDDDDDDDNDDDEILFHTRVYMKLI